MVSALPSVLVIEDNAEILTLALEVLEGKERTGALTGKSGFNKFKELCPDITFLDLGLPDIDGFVLLEDMLAYNPEAFIVILTQSNLEHDVRHAKTLGAMGYIIKPFSHKKIQEVNKAYLHYKDLLAQHSLEDRVEHLVQQLKSDVAEKYKDVFHHQEELPAQKKTGSAEIRTIPASKEKKESQKPASQKTELNRDEVMHHWRILFVDDFLVNRERAILSLGKLGCHVDVAENGYEALKKFSEDSYNMIFLDTDIGGEDGYRVAGDIREKERQQKKPEHNSVPIIALVENHAEIEDKRWLMTGMNEYVIKPISFSHLRALIEKYVQRHIAVLKEVI